METMKIIGDLSFFKTLYVLFFKFKFLVMSHVNSCQTGTVASNNGKTLLFQGRNQGFTSVSIHYTVAQNK